MMKLSSFPQYLKRFSSAPWDEKMLALIGKFNWSNKVAHGIASDKKHRKVFSTCVYEFLVARIKDMKRLREHANDFDYQHVVKVTVDNALQKIAESHCGPHTPKKHIHWAPTQSGKSAFKAIKILVYLTMNIPVIVITKGKSESIELAQKISRYLEDSRFGFENKVFSLYEIDYTEKSFLNVEKAFVLIIPDSYQKIELAHELFSESMQHAKDMGSRIAGCALILDEGDAIKHRSEEEIQKNEQALIKLQNELSPSIVMVTATPLSLLAIYLDEKPIVTRSNEEITNYIGVQDMVHIDPGVLAGFPIEVPPRYEFNTSDVFRNEASKKQYASIHAVFQSDEIQHDTKFPKVNYIPRINEVCMEVIEKELAGKGTLGLIDTCPWVTSNKGTVFEQASGIQDYFFTVLHEKFVAIVVHADKVFYRLPGHRIGFKCKKPIGELIGKIDKDEGLKMPVLAFGYHAMKRSRSFRSNLLRVPTFMIMCLGKGISAENCRQAAGRLTFKGRDILEDNRNTSRVTIVCSKEDYDIIQKHDQVVKEIFKLYLEKNMSWIEIMSNLSSSSRNFLDNCPRRLGNFTTKNGSTLRIEEELPDGNTTPRSSIASAPKTTAKNHLETPRGMAVLRNTLCVTSKDSTQKKQCASQETSLPEEIVVYDETSFRQDSLLSGFSEGLSTEEERRDTDSSHIHNASQSSAISKAKQQGKRKHHSVATISESDRKGKRSEVKCDNIEIKTEKDPEKRPKRDIIGSTSTQMIDLVFDDEQVCVVDLTRGDSNEIIDLADDSDQDCVIDISDSGDEDCAINLDDCASECSSMTIACV